MGAWLAIEQADLAEPVRRFDQRQRLLALAAHRADPHRPFQYRIQPTRRIATLEQALPRRQLAGSSQGQQAILNLDGQLPEPLPVQQLGTQIVHGTSQSGLCRPGDRRRRMDGASCAYP
jgi:hypothetical protein